MTPPVARLTTSGDYATAVSPAQQTSLAVSKPANVAVGDLLIALVSCQTALTTGQAVTETTGTWSIFGPAFVFNTTYRGATTWALQVTSANIGSLPSTWTWQTNAGGARWTITVFRVTGADLTNGLTSANAGRSAYSTYGSNNSNPIPSYTAAVGSLVVACAIVQNTTSQTGTLSWTVPGFTTQAGSYANTSQSASWSGHYLASKTADASGTEPSVQPTLSPAPAGGQSWSIAIAAAPTATAYNLTGSGGSAAGGSAALTAADAVTGSGGSTSTGSAPLSMALAATGSGGSAAGGTAALTSTLSLSGSGGSTGSGTATISASLPISASGGSTATGAAAVAVAASVAASGGSTSSGSAVLGSRMALAGSGGSVTDGTAAFEAATLSASGGSTSDGDAQLRVVLAVTAAGGSSSDGAVDLRISATNLTASGASQSAGEASLQMLLALTADGGSSSDGSVDIVLPYRLRPFPMPPSRPARRTLGGPGNLRLRGDLGYRRDVVATRRGDLAYRPGPQIVMDEDPTPAVEVDDVDQLIFQFEIRKRTRTGYDDDGNAVFEWSALLDGIALKWEERTEYDADAGATYVAGTLLVSNENNVVIDESSTAVNLTNDDVWRIVEVIDHPDSTELRMERISHGGG
jgi:hypothetical protein